ncbi:hypothetical protein Ddye_021412 [Dipteronia dyeriana]|uniref:Uncharacterized protein n=1 Tax=Dipteronia dyeriana TaxID=168575 RepID=A0AAD9WXP6_9ROSI|nr:hypothetical protein Ddye_021412 [Dipteronia dyeriana]
MFYFLYRSIAHGRHTIRASPAHTLLHYRLQKHPSKLVLFVEFISSNANHQQSFAVSYLINSCGLPLDSALRASKNVKFETPENPDLVLSFLKNRGFSNSHISVLIRKRPALLLSNPEKTFLPKFEFFYSKGVSSPDLVKILCLEPNILKSSLEERIIPCFGFLKDFLKSDGDVIASFKIQPRFLTGFIETYVSSNVEFLQENGVPKSNITALLLRYAHRFTRNPDIFKKTVEQVKGMGFDPLKWNFCLAVHAFMAMSKSTWERKVNLYKKWGLSEDEIFKGFGKSPWFMIVSEKKITKVMDFFVNEMGWKPSVISKHPVFITFSLQKRIIPRAAVFQFLLTKGLIKSKHAKLITLFKCNEKAFLERFVNSYDEAPQLWKLYKEKLDPAKITK